MDQLDEALARRREVELRERLTSHRRRQVVDAVPAANRRSRPTPWSATDSR